MALSDIVFVFVSLTFLYLICYTRTNQIFRISKELLSNRQVLHSNSNLSYCFVYTRSFDIFSISFATTGISLCFISIFYSINRNTIYKNSQHSLPEQKYNLAFYWNRGRRPQRPRGPCRLWVRNGPAHADFLTIANFAQALIFKTALDGLLKYFYSGTTVCSFVECKLGTRECPIRRCSAKSVAAAELAG